MKGIQIIFLTIGLFHRLMSQDIESLERKLSSGGLSTADSIETLNLIGRGLTFVNPLKGLAYANKALELSTKTNNSIGTAYAYRNLSSIYSYNDSYFISMEYIQRALDIFVQRNDSIGIANCYISLGHTYRQLQNINEEIDYHKKSYEIFKRLNDVERLGVTAHNLGESYYNAGNLSSSRELTLYAININDSLNNKPVLSSCYKVMGMIELSEKNLELAETYFKRVLELTTQLGDNSQKTATAESMIQLATVYKLLGDLDKQSQFLLMTAEFSDKNNLPSYLQRAYQGLILFSSVKKDPLAVQKYIYSYRAISDSLNQRQLRDRYNLTKSLIQTHELSKSKIELEKINLLQSQQIRNRNTVLLIIVISTAFLLWLLLKFTRLNKTLKDQNMIIESQKNELEILNNTKDKFFSIVAHDLKSPLNSLKSFSTLLIDHFDHLNKDEILNMSRQLRTSVDNTIKMADNLITWARIQMGDYHYLPETVVIKDIVTNICEVYKGVALKKGITLSCSVEDSVSIIGDKNQIEFVFRNLVNNAIKFTDKNGFVSLTAESLASGEVQVSVSDSGVGISDEVKRKLFLVGMKQSTTGTAGEKGTGLGLMLCYEFVKLNGGQIEIGSNVGRGTTFRTKFKRGH
jgi:signal transduction histidine kinase